MIWLATLVVCPSPLPPTSVMFLPISSNSGFTFSNAACGAADHDRERRALRADLAARDRRVEIVAAELVDALGEVLGFDRRDRAHVDDGLARAQPVGDAVRRRTALSRRPACRAPSVMMMSALLRDLLRARRRPCRPRPSVPRGTPLRALRNSVWPPLIRLSAMGLPMMPRPMNPIVHDRAYLRSIGKSSMQRLRYARETSLALPGRRRFGLVFAADPARVADASSAASRKP